MGEYETRLTQNVLAKTVSVLAGAEAERKFRLELWLDELIELHRRLQEIEVFEEEKIAMDCDPFQEITLLRGSTEISKILQIPCEEEIFRTTGGKILYRAETVYKDVHFKCLEYEEEIYARFGE